MKGATAFPPACFPFPALFAEPRNISSLVRMPCGNRSAAVPNRRRATVDAIKLLKDDHDEAKKMLERLDETTERAVKTRQELFTKLKAELVVHEAIEEEIFYPALKEHAEAKDI